MRKEDRPQRSHMLIPLDFWGFTYSYRKRRWNRTSRLQKQTQPHHTSDEITLLKSLLLQTEPKEEGGIQRATEHSQVHKASAVMLNLSLMTEAGLMLRAESHLLLRWAASNLRAHHLLKCTLLHLMLPHVSVWWNGFEANRRSPHKPCWWHLD